MFRSGSGMSSVGSKPLGLPQRLAAEALATAFLLTSVVGSGIMGDRLAGGNPAIALLANTLATGAALIALIITFAPLSGAHMNPVVTTVSAWDGAFPWREVVPYLTAQVIGAFAGVAVANVMFGEPLFSASTHVRAGFSQGFSEFVATFGLVAMVRTSARRSPEAVAYAVGAYITAAYWFTASTSFANPAVTLARAASNTFAGIRPSDVPMFLVAQALGAGAAAVFLRWLDPPAAHGMESRVVTSEPSDVRESDAVSQSADAEVGDELAHSRPYVVPDLPNDIQRQSLRIAKLPILSPHARHERALLAAAHRHQDVGLMGDLVREDPRHGAREVDTDLPHRGHYLGMDAIARSGARGHRSGLRRIRQPAEEGRRHLRTPGVVKTCEENGLHGIRSLPLILSGRPSGLGPPRVARDPASGRRAW
jgi:glycerol uptake facilitator-like aquaporin